MGKITNESQLMHASDRFLWVEECSLQTHSALGQTFGEADNAWDMYSGSPSVSPTQPFLTAAWLDSPAAFHGTSSTFNFADGHAESHKWISGLVVAFANSMNPDKYANIGGASSSALRLMRPQLICITLPATFQPQSIRDLAIG